MAIQWNSVVGPLGEEHDSVSFAAPVELDEYGRSAFRRELERRLTATPVNGLREWSIAEVDDLEFGELSTDLSVFLFALDLGVSEADLDVLRDHAGAAVEAAQESAQERSRAASRLLDYLRKPA